MSKHIIKDIDGKGTEIKKEASIGIERVEPSILEHEQRISGLESRENTLFEIEHDSTTGLHARANNFQDGILSKEDYLEFSKAKSSVAKRQAIQQCPIYQDAFDSNMGQADFLDAQLSVTSLPLEDIITEQFTFKSTDNGATTVTGDILGSVAKLRTGTLPWFDTGFEPGPGVAGWFDMNNNADRKTFFRGDCLPNVPRNTIGTGNANSPYVNTSFTIQAWGYLPARSGSDVLWQLGGERYNGLSIGLAAGEGDLPGSTLSWWIVGQGRGVRKRTSISATDLSTLVGGNGWQNIWMLHTVVYDIEAEVIKYYINQHLVGQLDMSDGWRISTGYFSDNGAPADALCVFGGTHNGGGLVLTGEIGSRPWEGFTQLWRFYDSVTLSESQIGAIYTQDMAKLNTEFGTAGDLVITTKNITANNPLIVSMAQGFEDALPKNLNKTFINNFNIGTVSDADVIANGYNTRYYVYLDYTTGNLQTGIHAERHPVYQPFEPMWWTPRNNHPFFNTTSMKFYDSTDGSGVRPEITRIYLGEVLYYEDAGVPTIKTISYRPKAEGILIFDWITQQGSGGAIVDGFDIKFNHNTGLPWEELHKTLSFIPRAPYSTAGIQDRMIEINPDHNTEIAPSNLNIAHSGAGVNRLTEYDLHIYDAGQIVNFYINGVMQNSFSGQFVFRFSRTW